MFFDSWADIARLVIVGSLSYAALVVLLRTSGKRTLAKMNAFDLVITVAFGSTFASAILSSDVSLSEGVGAFALLCGLQFLVAWLSTRSERFQNFVKSQPTLLFFRGQFLTDALRGERVTREEVFAAIRSSGAASLSKVDAVVLETDGTFSVLTGAPAENDITTLANVQGPDGRIGRRSF